MRGAPCNGRAIGAVSLAILGHFHPAFATFPAFPPLYRVDMAPQGTRAQCLPARCVRCIFECDNTLRGMIWISKLNLFFSDQKKFF